MQCPECRSDTAVIDSRKVRDVVLRRRRCCNCGYKFTTREHVYRTQIKRKRQRKKIKPKVRLPKSRIVTKLIIPVDNDYTKRILQKLDSR